MAKKKIAVKEDWTTFPMPEKREHFHLERHFSEEEIRNISRGNIPQEMEDKWFWYVENGILFAHRSWTGYCIFTLTLDEETDIHEVTVNRDPEQYDCTDIQEDIETINSLLDWWEQPVYDYYDEWLSETVDALKRSGEIPEDPRSGKEE